jgi:hypothetical protein
MRPTRSEMELALIGRLLDHGLSPEIVGRWHSHSCVRVDQHVLLIGVVSVAFPLPTEEIYVCDSFPLELAMALIEGRTTPPGEHGKRLSRECLDLDGAIDAVLLALELIRPTEVVG